MLIDTPFFVMDMSPGCAAIILGGMLGMHVVTTALAIRYAYAAGKGEK